MIERVFTSVLLMVVSCCASARAQQLSWNVPSPQSASVGGGAYIFGTEFTVSRAMSATGLAYYDDTFASADGLAAAHEVALFDGQTGQMVASATVPAGTAAPRLGAFRTVTIPGASLLPGRTYIVAGAIAGDPTINVSAASGSLTSASGVSVGRWVAAFQSTMTRPMTELSVTTNSMGAAVVLTELLAGAPAWTLPSLAQATGNQGQFGTEFSVRSPVTVTALGCYDDTYATQPGFLGDQTVTLWDATSGQRLSLAIVPAGTGAPFTGGFRYVSVNPVRLAVGRRYIAAAVGTAQDPGVIVAPATLMRDARVTTHSWRSGSGPGPTFPGEVINTPNLFFGAGFLLRPGCAPDYDGDGGANLQDLFDFLTAWFGGAEAGDFNGSAGVTLQDIFDFLGAWFAGC